jgi:hypothetical protein
MTNDGYRKKLAWMAVAGIVAVILYNWRMFAFLNLLIFWAILAQFIPNTGR